MVAQGRPSCISVGGYERHLCQCLSGEGDGAEKYPQAKIEIMDSRSNSMQLGFAAIVSARWPKKAKAWMEVKEAAENNIRAVGFYLYLTILFIYKRWTDRGASALIGNLLRIIPVLILVKTTDHGAEDSKN